ncbi:hypoxanthine phosphoribosyltransferase [Anthocerotibacter panamensis]|uniref:hypoxanthine phosphoribosyltransferase n=1 Tax=Anthocerotibacter panamensis TaxID=2857077 RepID=UPI001C407B02|nr:hypoxanthine phosphoribosyltransferase [Anthocerotibacter panamensis]
MKILYSAEALFEAVARLGTQINRDYQHQTTPLMLVVVLKGSFIFAADLMRQLTIPCEVEFIRASSYRQGTTAGELCLDWGMTKDFGGRDVLVLEDVVDSGQTLHAILTDLKTQTRTVRLCALLDKPEKHRVPVTIDYCGFQLLGDPFVVGYGLDYAEQHRGLPYIGVLGGA